jgi:hypothetical protein
MSLCLPAFPECVALLQSEKTSQELAFPFHFSNIQGFSPEDLLVL